MKRIEPGAGNNRNQPACSALLPSLLVMAALVLAPAPQAGAQGAAADGTVVIDGLMWAARSNGEDVLWAAANEYCANLELAGHDDWRLPTLAEVESVYDAAAQDNGFIKPPLILEGCCLWSSTSLADLSADDAGVRGGQRDEPSNYFWGLLFSGGIRYYSINYFPDGQAHCVRDVGG